MASTITLNLDSKPAIAALAAYSRAMAGEMRNTEDRVRTAGAAVFTFNQAWDASAKVLGKVKQAFELLNSAFQQVVVKTAAADEQLGSFAQSIFSSVEQATKLDLIGRRFNITQAEMSQALKGLTNKLYEASNGSQEAQQVFDKLGIRIKDLNTGVLRPASDVMLEVADKFQKMGTSSEKSAMSIKLFEEGGLKLIPLLNQGSNGIEKMGNWFDRLGITATESSVQMATEFSRNWRTLDLMFEGVVATLGRKLMPAFVQASEAAIKYGADLIQRIDWEKVINYVGLFTKAIGFATSATAGFAVPFFAVADAIQVGLMGALSTATTAISELYKTIASGLQSAGELAAKLGRDGLAKELKTGAAELNKFAKSIDELGVDIAEKSLDFHDAGTKAILTMNDVGKGAMKLGDDIQKSTTSSTSSVKNTSAAFVDMGKASKDTLAKDIPDAGKKTVEILRGGVEPAVKSLGTSLKQTTESFVDGGPKMVDALERVQGSAENGVMVMRGLGREVTNVMTELGKVQFSLSGWKVTDQLAGVAASRKAFGLPAEVTYGKPPGSAFDNFQARQGRRGAEIDSFSGFVGSGSFEMDPFTAAFAQHSPGLSGDLLTGRASAITGDRFNQFREGLLNEPYNQASHQYQTEEYFARKDARLANAAASGGSISKLAATGSAMDEAEKHIVGKTKKIFQDEIPASLEKTATAAVGMTSALSGMLGFIERGKAETAANREAAFQKAASAAGVPTGNYEAKAKMDKFVAAQDRFLMERRPTGESSMLGGGGRTGGGGISSMLTLGAQLSAVAAAEAQAGASTAGSFDQAAAQPFGAGGGILREALATNNPAAKLVSQFGYMRNRSQGI